MSSTYVTVLSGSVTVGEAGDAVTVHVTGQIGWMRRGVLRSTGALTGDELWRIGDPTSPGAAVLEGLIPFRPLVAEPASRLTAWSLYVADSGTPDQLWRIDDPTSPGAAVLEGSLPSGLSTPTGITSHGGSLYVADTGTPDQLWRIDDPTSPGAAVLEGSLPLRPLVAGRHHVSRRVALRGGHRHSRSIMADRRPDISGRGGAGRLTPFRPLDADRHHVSRRVALRGGQHGRRIMADRRPHISG